MNISKLRRLGEEPTWKETKLEYTQLLGLKCFQDFLEGCSGSCRQVFPFGIPALSWAYQQRICNNLTSSAQGTSPAFSWHLCFPIIFTIYYSTKQKLTERN